MLNDIIMLNNNFDTIVCSSVVSDNDNIFVSYVKNDGKGLYTKDNLFYKYNIESGKVHLPKNKKYNKEGLSVIKPIKESDRYFLSEFHKIEPYMLQNNEYNLFFEVVRNLYSKIDKDESKDYAIEIYKDDGLFYFNIKSKYCTVYDNFYNFYTIMSCIINGKEHLVFAPLFLYHVHPSPEKFVCSDIEIDGSKYIPFDNRTISGIFRNLNAYIDILEYAKFLTDDYAKSYVRDDDYDFLSEEDVDVLNNMIDDNIAYMIFIEGTDDYMLVVNSITAIRKLFNKYSLNDILTLSIFNAKIRGKLGYKIKIIDRC